MSSKVRDRDQRRLEMSIKLTFSAQSLAPPCGARRSTRPVALSTFGRPPLAVVLLHTVQPTRRHAIVVNVTDCREDGWSCRRSRQQRLKQLSPRDGPQSRVIYRDRAVFELRRAAGVPLCGILATRGTGRLQSGAESMTSPAAADIWAGARMLSRTTRRRHPAATEPAKRTPRRPSRPFILENDPTRPLPPRS